MTDAERLRKALDRALSRHALLAERAVTRRMLTPTICRAIVKEFGLERNCRCDWDYVCVKCDKHRMVGRAILDVAEADDE